MSADSPRHGGASRPVPAVVPPQVVSDRSILDSAIGFINDVTLANQPHTDPNETITWARFETAADISDPRFGEDWEVEGNVAPPLLLILGYGLGVQVWAIPANGEAVEVLSWRHGSVTALRVLPTPASSSAIEENGRADEPGDAFADKRPIIALVDGSSSAGVQPQFCAVNFVSLRTGAQVKTIKFKNPVIDILANRSSIVITFNERIAVFDARTLEDRLSVTTCFPSPGVNPNPVALGARWLAYAEHKLLHSKRSGGGCDGEAAASYTATMLNAAKSIGKGLRDFGEQMAMGLTGTTGSGGTSKNNSFDSNSGDIRQPGIITILDIKHAIKDYSPTSGMPMSGSAGNDPIVAHFVAHSEAVVAVEFDNSGMMLVTADRRGNDFHVFRIQPHPVGSSLAAVQHLYILHRGDTSAKVQNIAFTLDSRWVAVSTLRGTTHVFPITPYGGAMGVRTHTSLHVVNKLSRFHRSAGLSAEGRSSSPISHSESITFLQSLMPYHNATLPPFPRPTTVHPLAQLRQPFALGSPPGSAAMPGAGHKLGGGSGSGVSQRQRLSSLSDDNGKPLSVCAIFAKSRSWLLDPPNATREASHRQQHKAVDSLFVMAGHGALIQYDLDTKLASNVAKEKICDDTPIELEVAAKAQWNLGRRKDGSQEIMPPLSLDNWLIKDRQALTDSTRQFDETEGRTESWLSQVEIITHAGPHRRLWMGPQFVFKTYNTPSGSNLNHIDMEAVEIGLIQNTTTAAATTTRIVERSSPLNMPLSAAGRSSVPVLIESGSYSSIELSPKLNSMRHRHDHLDSDYTGAHGESRLKEDLADAMRESPSVSTVHKDTGRLLPSDATSDNIPFYDALAEHDEGEPSFGSSSFRSLSSAGALASALPNISSFERGPSDAHRRPKIEKYVNSFGTVTTVNSGMSVEVHTHDVLDEVVSQLALEEVVIHENCDEALFRPVVAIFCDEEAMKRGEEEARKLKELCRPPEVIGNNLIVPVIEKEVDEEICKKEKQKSDARRREQECDKDVQKQFAEFSTINKRSKGKSSKDGVNVNVEIKNTNVLKNVETKNIKTSVEPACVEDKTKCELIKTAEHELFVKEKFKPETNVNSLEIEEKLTTTKKSENKSKSEVPLEKSKIESIEKFEVEEKLEIIKEVQKKESSKKSKRNSEERELKLPQKLLAEEQSVEIKKITSSTTEKLAKQTAVNAKSQSAKEKTAAAAENKKFSKAAIKQTTEIKPTLKLEIKEQTTSKDLSTKTNTVKTGIESKETKAKTEQLHVADLADSLIEIKVVKEETKDNSDKAAPIVSEPVETYDLPKMSRKIKSEMGEVVEVTAVTTEHFKIKYVEQIPQIRKQLSESSDDCYIDLADSLLENKSKLEDTMFVSFTHTEPTSTSIDMKFEAEHHADTTSLAKKEFVKKTRKHEDDIKTAVYVTVEKDNIKTKKVTTEVDETEPKEPASKHDSNDGKEQSTTNKQTAKTLKEIDFFKKPGIIEIKEAEGPSKKVSLEVLEGVKTCIVTDYKEKQQKVKESKGAIKKEYKQKDSPKSKDLEEQVEITDFIKKETVVELAIKTEIMPVESTPIKETTAVIEPEIVAPKSSKRNTTDVTKAAVELVPKAMDHVMQIEKLKLKKLKNDSKLEEVRVITEQPTKNKKTKNESQPCLYQSEKPKNVLPPVQKTEDFTEVVCVSNKKDSTKKNAKVLSQKCSAVDDEIDGFDAATSKSYQEKCLLNIKVKISKDIETKAVGEKLKSPPAPTFPVTSVWQTLSGAEVLKNVDNIKTDAVVGHQYPSLAIVGHTKKAAKPTPLTELETKKGKLLPDIPTPLKLSPDFKEPIGISKINSKSKKLLAAGFDDFPLLKPLESLAPLPSLEPLELLSATISKVKESDANILPDQMSLINFESPEKQDNPELELKISPSPRGFTEQNLVFALCGSLHYENESGTATNAAATSTITTKRETTTPEKSDISPTTDCKSLTENDEPYMSLDQSSQETNTTTTTTYDKFHSTSPYSSSEEIIVVEEKKMTKKQKRKKQQMDVQKHREQLNDSANEVDEELRPLIAMSESLSTSRDHFEVSAQATTRPHDHSLFLAESLSLPSAASSVFSPRRQLTHCTTTDSEGPMPATTSDDNVYTLPPAVMTTSMPHKLKTKKLEHKINLIAAIEAATSSSTSSAEESGQEAGGRDRASEMDGSSPPLITIAATVAQHDRHQMPPIMGTTAAMQSALKKKTKRRKR